MIRTRLYSLSALSLCLMAANSGAAEYRIMTLEGATAGQYSFAKDISGDGQVAYTLEDAFNPKIDLSLLDLENNQALLDLLEDPDAVKDGDISATDLQRLFDYLRSNNNISNPFFQKIGRYRSYISAGSELEEEVAFDVVDTELGYLSRSVDTQTQKMNQHGDRVGIASAPFKKIEHVNEDGDEQTMVYREFGRRGFANIDGIFVPLASAATELGGYSEANGISDNRIVAGRSALEPGANVTAAVEACADEETRGDRPEEVCISGLIDSYIGGIVESFKTRATLWELDAQGSVLDTHTFGLLFEPAGDDTRSYTSAALDVNDNAVAVGYSSHRYRGNENQIVTFAAVFKDEQVSGFIDDQEYFASVATAVNNQNIVTGQASKYVNGYARTKFFVYDIDEQTLVFPDDFFPGSSSVGRSINNHGLVVGDGEVDSVIGNTVRRRHAFIYDHNEASFQDLNNLVSCDTPYTLVQANGINDNGEIAATATINRPQLDITGQPVLDDAGNQVMEDAVVAVKLVPIPGGTAEDCSAEEPKTERKAGTLHWAWLTILTLFGLFRDRKGR
ncbi:DUF3466 family protein [Aliiglaciecola sp. CAU 1673]|uniref:DUF3466 family protein n=1 Tax=Aliiglaciecola sp. CAU 1673 TaxID=3032595 RepID=UPI0023DAD15A|nr:DUF3466 family protein [Aliiglaciecola sp. CAU 1673]MDF2177521.1 DUF3466 family protein [Aliiglaciecola sp. CAU 1673]